MQRIYSDRADAGRELARAVSQRVHGDAVVVLGLPRGGVPVAREVARALRAPLDVLVVRKVGAPFQPELALGAVARDGVTVRNEDVLAQLPGAAAEFESLADVQRTEVERREHLFRGGRPALALAGRTAVLVDDGVATGATARAAIDAARALGAARVVFATPVASRSAAELLRTAADDLVCLQSPAFFAAVGQAYADFTQVEDDTVRRILAASERPPAQART